MKPFEHQLLLSKYLFLRGSDALRENGRYSAGLAVSLFQDAVESIISTVAKELGASVPPNTTFHSYWDLVKKTPNAQGRELPPSGKMVELNAARVAFKHHGVVPAQEAAANLELHTEEFLTEATRRFFSLDFATLSLVSFLSDKEAAEFLTAAETALKNGDVNGALEECAKCFSVVSQPVGFLVPAIGHDLSSAIGHASADGRAHAAVIGALEKAHAALRKVVVTTALGLSVVDYTRFCALLPSAARFGSGKFQIIWSPMTRTLEDAKFAVRFLTKYALAVERTIEGIPPEARRYLW